MKIVIGPLEAVPGLCAAHRPSHLVSWLSPPGVAPELSKDLAPERRLLLSSHDLAEPMEGLQAPTSDHVRQLLGFAASWRGERPMLIHCWAGVSRSTAAAYAIACQARADLPEVDLARRLRDLSPTATPNPLIVSLADQFLRRAGRMSEAIAKIGRGVEAATGGPFVFDLD